MNKSEDLPFKIGTMWHGDGVPSLTDAMHLEGKDYYLEDIDYASGQQVKPARSGRYRKVRIVRNVAAGGILAAKLIAKFQTNGTGAEFLTKVDGLAAAPADKGYPIDEFLPLSIFIPQYALFYVVVEGPATVTTLAAAPGSIVVGGFVASGAGGKVALAATSEAALGRSTKATSAINTDIVIDVGAK